MLLLVWFGCAPEGDADAGATVYTASCATCHGETGDAQIPWSGVPAADLRAAIEELDEEGLSAVVTDGSGAMPPISGLSAQDVADVVAYCFATFTGKP